MAVLKDNCELLSCGFQINGRDATYCKLAPEDAFLQMQNRMANKFFGLIVILAHTHLAFAGFLVVASTDWFHVSLCFVAPIHSMVFGIVELW